MCLLARDFFEYRERETIGRGFWLVFWSESQVEHLNFVSDLRRLILGEREHEPVLEPYPHQIILGELRLVHNTRDFPDPRVRTYLHKHGLCLHGSD